MTLETLGYNLEIEHYRKENNLDPFGVGRIIAEHRERYIVKTTEGEYEGEVIGNLRFTANSRSDFPAVGDWVAISEYDDDKILIHKVFPRKTVIERKSVGKRGEKQIIATNIDVALIVQSINRDFNINRLERYLSIANTSKVEPIILLTKTDLIHDDKIALLVEAVKKRIPDVTILPVSNKSGKGIEELATTIESGKTYCLLGSSGVGKSSLLNSLVGKPLMKTRAISDSSDRGKHVTTHRELHVLDDGGILIDNPGMREIGITDAAESLESTFGKNCRTFHAV